MVFSDPIFETAAVKATDINELVSTLPAVGRAVLDLYAGYRRHLSAGPDTGAGDDTSEAPPVTTSTCSVGSVRIGCAPASGARRTMASASNPPGCMRIPRYRLGSIDSIVQGARVVASGKDA